MCLLNSLENNYVVIMSQQRNKYIHLTKKQKKETCPNHTKIKIQQMQSHQPLCNKKKKCMYVYLFILKKINSLIRNVIIK